MAIGNVLDIVWGETAPLISKDGQDATLGRLHAVVARLAMTAQGRGLDNQLRKASAPRVGDPEAASYEKMKATVDAVHAGTWIGSPLPARAAIWEITATGVPRIEAALPPAARWILDPDVAAGGDFVIGGTSDGRIYRLFESKTSAPDGEMPFVSMVSGSGLAAPGESGSHSRLAWTLGVVGVALLIFGGAVSAWSGAGVSAGRKSLAATSPAAQYQLVLEVVSVCTRDAASMPFGTRASVCDSLLGEQKRLDLPVDAAKINWDGAASVLVAAAACPTDPTKPDCNTLWRAAVAVDRDQRWRGQGLRWMAAAAQYLDGSAVRSGSVSIVAAFLVVLIGIAGLVVGLGIGTKGRATGVWIDTRNRVSLARVQVTLWTIVALAGYMVLAMFNIGFSGILPSSAALVSYQAFPLLPASIAAALGIATASPMLSALILPTKDTAGQAQQFTIAGSSDDANARTRGVPFFGTASSGLEKRASPALASMADIFMGEEKANADTVDVARLQNVVITIMLIGGFFSILMGMMSDISAATLLGAKGPIFTSLPELGATFTSLLLVSHATYLVAKAYDPHGPKTPAGGQG